MSPIYQLLSRSHWGKRFEQGAFAIISNNEFEDTIIRIPFREIIVMPHDHFAADLIDREGVLHTVPLDQVRDVYKDGELIWHRKRDR